MFHASFFFIWRCCRQTKNHRLAKFMAKLGEHLPPMFGQMMTLIEDDQANLCLLQRLNGSLSTFVEPR